MKKHLKKILLMTCILTLLTGCNNSDSSVNNNALENTTSSNQENTLTEERTFENATVIQLSDEMITVDGNPVTNNTENAVYTANDIVFYLDGQDFTYGEGTEADAHSQAEANAHTVVHITKPGRYVLSGKLSAGQIAVDLGENAEDDPAAVVTLILNGVDINCSVAPAVIFYNVYECGSNDTETATKDIDTTAAGANILLPDNSHNFVKGSYVARIYESVELNENGTKVVDSEKLHKYDGAFYSKMSMNINGEEENTGDLTITAENEGLDSELHLTINGGHIVIYSGNDGINTNEDGVSVTTINGGFLTIKVTGATGEGDGIDSNGWLVINGGHVLAEACSTSADAGIDSDMGIHINGGDVFATGNMLDRISESTQNYAVFNFTTQQKAGTSYTLERSTGPLYTYTPENDFTYLIFSTPNLHEDSYTFWQNDEQLAGAKGEAMGGMTPPDSFEGGQRPEGMTPPNGFEGGQRPEGMTPSDDFEIGQHPEGMTPPDGFEISQRPSGNKSGFGMMEDVELSTEFMIEDGGNYFSFVSKATETAN